MATLFNNVANTNTVNYVPVQATFSASGGFLTFIGPGGVPFTAGGSLSINSTSITGGTSGRVLFNNAGTVGEKTVTGTGNVVLSASPTLSGTVNLSSLTASQAIFTDASKNIVSKAVTGTGSVVLNTDNPTFADDVSVTGNIAAGSGGFGNISANTGTFYGSITVNAYPISSGANLDTLSIAIGTGALSLTTFSLDNTAIGNNALLNVTDGYNNVALGNNAGKFLTSGYSNIYFGYGSSVSSGSVHDEIVIGNQTGGGNYTTIIGNVQTTSTKLMGKLVTSTYTVATLPTGTAGSRSFVTNALTPTFGATVVGGGSVGVPVYHDGTSWKVG